VAEERTDGISSALHPGTPGVHLLMDISSEDFDFQSIT
jgi:hypothetical protein